MDKPNPKIFKKEWKRYFRIWRAAVLKNIFIISVPPVYSSLNDSTGLATAAAIPMDNPLVLMNE